MSTTFLRDILVTGKKRAHGVGRWWGGGGLRGVSDGLLHLIIFFMLAACLSGISMGFFLGQAYVRILLGPEIGDVWVGEEE